MRKGNIMRVSEIASARSCEAKPGAIISTNTGANISPTATTKLHPKISTVKASFASFLALSLPSAERVRENTGTNDAESAPSASSCRERFASV